ncbi:DUF309 domain-containing protein [Actinomadura atramentaria]|uniref:DUF309 domain-containing protein n=1 Tax=Actinomadura atramentaria TaxID=1990 RepID=UPI00036177CC|nr:DUF309 domain-containing protein [Actinomadura atramentaria]
MPDDDPSEEHTPGGTKPDAETSERTPAEPRAENAAEPDEEADERAAGRTRPAGDAVTRDRDPAGRARNARPRDAYGRPLPHGATGVPTMPDDLDPDPVRGLAEAQRLLDADRPFHAHEVLEAVWKGAPPDERELWRSLAQVAVGITHLRRGNPRGARALLDRATAALEPWTARAPHGVDAAGVIAATRALLTRPDTELTPDLPIVLNFTR